MTDDRVDDVRIRAATIGDVAAVHATRLLAAEDLTARFGPGHWSQVSAARTLTDAVAAGTLYVIEHRDSVVGTFRLSADKIGFYQLGWFAEPKAPAAYLRDMAIAPDCQLRGIGRGAMAALEGLAAERDAAAVRLDAYVGPAGAGGFYRKCGYTCVHRGVFNGVSLEYFEKRLLGAAKK